MNSIIWLMRKYRAKKELERSRLELKNRVFDTLIDAVTTDPEDERFQEKHDRHDKIKEETSVQISTMEAEFTNEFGCLNLDRHLDTAINVMNILLIGCGFLIIALGLFLGQPLTIAGGIFECYVGNVGRKTNSLFSE